MPAHQQEGNQLKLLNSVFAGFIVIGLFAALFAGGFSHWATLTLWALACLAIGGFIGLLFGIPRGRRPATNGLAGSAPGTAPESGNSVNNNLIEISDWLTKIIVGLGLVELHKIPDLLRSVASPLAVCIGSDCGFAIAFGVVIFFTVAGFLGGYINARTMVARLLDDYDRGLLEKIDRIESQSTQALETAKGASDDVRLNLAPAPVDVAVRPASVADVKRSSVAEAAWTVKPGNEADDPWKGVFGGKPEANFRKLSATVEPSEKQPHWYRVKLRVESTDPTNHPLTGRVRFFLHDTFQTDKPFILVNNGVAELRFGSYGAFTVGVLADGGATKLELDLAELESAPKEFREA